MSTQVDWQPARRRHRCLETKKSRCARVNSRKIVSVFFIFTSPGHRIHSMAVYFLLMITTKYGGYMCKTGYDCFFANPGKETEMKCKVCGTICIVTKDMFGPTSWASALGKKYSKHDRFKCPHIGKEWHKKALKLFEEIEKCPSRRLSELMKVDLQEILMEKNRLFK